MAYTPINWQTGDTITAEKMNKMDNGWGVSSTELFSETVTTTAGQMGNSATLTYSEPITSASLSVTFDGVGYVLPGTQNPMGYLYGEMGDQGPDFTNYPLFIMSTNSSSGNTIYTATAGTHTISSGESTVEVGEDFSKAVSTCVSEVVIAAKQCIPDVTNLADISLTATEANLLYFYSPTYSAVYIIQKAGSPCVIMPENSSITASFGRDDGVFRLTEN